MRRQQHGISATRRAMLQLLASAVLLTLVYFVATPSHLPRTLLLSTRPMDRVSFSDDLDEEWKDRAREAQLHGSDEVDIDVSSDPAEQQVSNMDITVAVKRPHTAQKSARKAHKHEKGVKGVSVSWASRARTSALARTQKLTAAYLEDQGINTGEEWNHVLDNRVGMGNSNPSVFFAATRQVPDLQPNPPATAHPSRHLNKLTRMGIYTGTEHSGDDLIASKGMEEPYSFGASPVRDWNSPSRRAGSWGIFKPTADSGFAMLADTAKDDLSQVLSEKRQMLADEEDNSGNSASEEVGGQQQMLEGEEEEKSDAPAKSGVEEKGGVKVDSEFLHDPTMQQHMQVDMDPRTAWAKPPASNGNLKTAGVNTGEEHWQDDIGDVHVPRGEVSPVHVAQTHHLKDTGVNTGEEAILHVDKAPEVYVPATVATAEPRKTKQHKLDKLGVNTGDEHAQWGDAMVHKAENLEGSYNLGISPMREYTAATPFPGTANYNKGDISADLPIPGAAQAMANQAKGQQLRTAPSPHDFFKKSVLPHIVAKPHDGKQMKQMKQRREQTLRSKSKQAEKEPPRDVRGKKTAKAAAATPHQLSVALKCDAGDAACEEALPYILEADAAKARAAESEAALAREVYNARKAESRAEDARNAAIKVGEAKVAANEAKQKLADVKAKFEARMSAVATQMPKARQHKEVVKKAATRELKTTGRTIQRQMTKEQQSVLDYNAQQDTAENHALATADDVEGVLSSVNLPSPHGNTHLYTPPHRPAVEPDQAGPLSALSAGNRPPKASTAHEKNAQQLEEQLHALPPRRLRATAERHHKMLHAAHAHSKGISFDKKELCAVSVWGVHPLCPDVSSYHADHEANVW